MNVTLTVIISTIVALSSVFSPIIVTLINNRHQIRLKKIEVMKDNAIRAYEAYLCELESRILDNNLARETSYKKSLGTAMLYASEKSQRIMLDIDEDLKRRNKSEITQKIVTLCLSFHSDIKI